MNNEKLLKAALSRINENETIVPLDKLKELCDKIQMLIDSMFVENLIDIVEDIRQIEESMAFLTVKYESNLSEAGMAELVVYWINFHNSENIDKCDE